MVSLSALSQYPTTKKIKGEQVVIMTVNQAKSIDEKFQMLEDSIIDLNNQLNGCGTSLNFTQNKVDIYTDSITNLNQQITYSQDSIVKLNKVYKQEVKKIDKLEFIDKRTRFQVKLGLILVSATWIFGILSSE
jgi:hypothetical protein